MLPFFATFMVGLIVAGLFGGFGGSPFRGRGWERRMEYQHIRCENERLREENKRLQEEMNNLRMNSSDLDGPALRDLPTLERDLVVPAPQTPPVKNRGYGYGSKTGQGNGH